MFRYGVVLVSTCLHAVAWFSILQGVGYSGYLFAYSPMVW